MVWRQTDRIQLPAALMVRDAPDPVRQLMVLQNRSSLFANLHVSVGEDWAILFSSRSLQGDIVLPHIPKSTALYETRLKCWLPVGTAWNIPEAVQDDYIARIRKNHNVIDFPAIFIPRFSSATTTRHADLYAIRDQVPLSDIIEPAL